MSTDFFFVGNHLAVDFTNTVVRGPDGIQDLLTDADAFRRWLQAAGLPLPAAGIDATGLATALELREAIRRAFGAWRTGEVPAKNELNMLNRALDHPRPVPLLARRGDELVRRLPDLELSVEEALWPIADRASDLLVRGDRRRLKACAGHDCVLSFLDISRNGSRRWCRMDACGNRSKAARHYRRCRPDDGHSK